MLIGKVTATVVSTRKLDCLVGSKFLEVKLMESGKITDKTILAIDGGVGAGIGETVLITTGSSARICLTNPSTPVDAVIVGIVD